MQRTITLFFYVILTLFLSVYSYGQEPSVVFTTDLPTGSSLTLSVRMADGADSVSVDMGSGQRQSFKKNIWSDQINISAATQGKNITIYGQLKTLDASSLEWAPTNITAISFTRQSLLEQLELSKNKLTKIDLKDLGALTHLTLSGNPLVSLTLGSMPNIEYITANDCRLTSFTIQDAPRLLQLTLSQNDLSNLLLPTLPKLTMLDVSENALLTIDLTLFPLLSELKIGNNGLTTLDLTPATKLERLFIENNFIRSLSLEHTPNLNLLVAYNNLLSRVVVDRLENLKTLNLRHNALTSIDLRSLKKLTTLNIGANEDLQDINVDNNKFLKRLDIDSTAIAGIELDNNTNLNYVNVRHTRLDACALNYLFMGLPAINPSHITNLYISHTAWKGCDHTIAMEKNWKLDIDIEQNDTTAPCQSYTVKIAPVAHASLKATYQNKEFASGESLTAGTLLRLHIEPEEGYELDKIAVSQEDNATPDKQIPIQGTGYVVQENAMLYVHMRKIDLSAISFTTDLPKGTEVALSLRLSADAPNDYVRIDWGNGVYIETPVAKHADEESGSVVEGVVEGSTIHIEGPLERLRAEQMEITSIDLTHAAQLKELDLYMNALETVDLTACKLLELLDLSYNTIKSIDLSQQLQLRKLAIYSNPLTSLSLEKNLQLTILNAKNLQLTKLEMLPPHLESIDLQNNKLESIDLQKLSQLKELRLSGNALRAIDLSRLPELQLLTISNNDLQELNCVENKLLSHLEVENNQLSSLTIGEEHAQLSYVAMGDNHMDACQLDEFYKSLPHWVENPSDKRPVTLFNKGTNAQKENEAKISHTSIATAKGWRVSEEGDGSGCLDAAQEVALGNAFNYYVQGCRLHLFFTEDYADLPVRIYSIQGSLISATTQGTERVIELSKGMYILTFSNKTYKIEIP